MGSRGDRIPLGGRRTLAIHFEIVICFATR